MAGIGNIPIWPCSAQVSAYDEALERVGNFSSAWRMRPCGGTIKYTTQESTSYLAACAVPDHQFASAGGCYQSSCQVHKYSRELHMHKISSMIYGPMCGPEGNCRSVTICMHVVFITLFT